MHDRSNVKLVTTQLVHRLGSANLLERHANSFVRIMSRYWMRQALFVHDILDRFMVERHALERTFKLDTVIQPRFLFDFQA